MSPQLIQKLPAITLLEGMFPELSTNQLKVCVFFFFFLRNGCSLRRHCSELSAFSRNGTNLPEAKPEEFKSGRI
uniref:Uncharacterized protein n=1 Tax=Escherichia coli TaxID=562 RepID=A0A8F1IFM2_ECOLX|nr:hypothetical protein IHCLGBEB_00183 [Escherichia coli]